MKKYLAILLSVMLMLSLAVPAMAYDLTINNSVEGYTYAAYQVFAGKLSYKTDADGDFVLDSEGNKIPVLSDITWGSGVTDAGKIALQESWSYPSAAALAASLDNTNVKVFAKEVAGYLTDTPTATEQWGTDKDYKFEGLAAGYYLVRNTSIPESDGAFTDYILEVVDDTTVNPKTSAPTLDKKVADVDDETGNGVWGDSADYDIDAGELIPYQLTATLPEGYENFETYTITFHDDLPVGITDPQDVTVYWQAAGGDVAFGLPESIDSAAKNCKSEAWTVETGDDVDCEKGCDLHVTVRVNALERVDGQALQVKAGDRVIVRYHAVMTAQANSSNASGNTNNAALEYPNNPNSEGTGTTASESATVFTYELHIEKKDENNKALNGAMFKLEKMELGDNYDDEEAFESWTDAPNENPSTLYTGKWRPIAVSNANPTDTFQFRGLSDGWYRLTETVTPAGYNSIEPIYFVLDSDHSGVDASGRPITVKLSTILTDEKGNYITELNENNETVNKPFAITHDATTGLVHTIIVNHSGATLPETGGMGTTIFYTVGGIMVAAAAILLVTKKRMGAEG